MANLLLAVKNAYLITLESYPFKMELFFHGTLVSAPFWLQNILLGELDIFPMAYLASAPYHPHVS